MTSRQKRKSRKAILQGRVPDLQEKTWQVLQFLREKSPGVVSRAEIIETVWKGHAFTGEKGLNQAIWSLRKALDDDAHAPTFIRTLPREGYQWIHTPPPGQTRRLMRVSFMVFIGLSLVMLSGGSMVPLASGPETAVSLNEDPAAIEMNAEMIATTAILENNNIVVDFQSGCRGVIESSEGKIFGQPVLSENGIYVAFTVHKEASCKTVMLNVDDHSHQEFDFCPTAVI